MMFNYTGKTALITGASSGLGVSFSNYLSQKGCTVILVARDEKKLHELAAHLQATYANQVYVIAHDLRLPQSGRTLLERVKALDLEVDILVNNAGVSTFGPFESIDALDEQAHLMVNINSLVDLTHAFIPSMVAKNTGAIINLASVLSFLPLPKNSVYAASKAFVLAFSEALHAEYSSQGIHVFALCPGPTASQFFERMGLTTPKNSDTTDDVVWRGMSAFEKGRSYSIPNFSYAFQMFMLKFLPRRIVYNIARSVANRNFKNK